MKLKRFICLFLCAITCLLGCSCGEYIQGLQCPWAEYTEDGNLIYEGNLYIARSNFSNDGYIVNYKNWYPILKTPWMYGPITMTVSENDSDKNIIHGYGLYYVKDSLNLPKHAFECEISNIYFETRGLENNIRINLDALEYPLSHIVEGEGLSLFNESGRLDGANSLKISCYLEFTQYDFLLGYYSVVEYNGELYFEQINDAYKIKDEYQEIFRNAIEELNA